MAARRRRDNVLFGVLAVLAVLGGLNAVFGFLFSSEPAPPSDAATTSIVSHAQLAGSFAEDFVVAYLGAGSGSQELVAKYVTAGQITLPPTGQRVSEPMVVFVQPVVSTGGLEVWTVTVSVRPSDRSGPASAQRQFYRVSVSVTDGRLRALSLPAAVEAPGRGVDLSLKYAASCSTDTPVAPVASGFVSAFLAGSGDLNRYTSTDAGITALTPAPYSSVDTVLIQSDESSCGVNGSTVHLLATVVPHTASGTTASLAYPLTLIRSGGQWQVQTMDSVPSLSDPVAVVANNNSSQGAGTSSSASATPTTASATVPPATHN